MSQEYLITYFNIIYVNYIAHIYLGFICANRMLKELVILLYK